MMRRHAPRFSRRPTPDPAAIICRSNVQAPVLAIPLNFARSVTVTFPLPGADTSYINHPMRIACVGGGPAGLVFAISMKLRDPRHDIVVFERNDPGDTFGWGVVFSDQPMENLRANDEKSADEIEAGFAHWDDIDVHIHGQTITSSGHGFVGIGRKRLLNILQNRARELDVRLDFQTEIEPSPELFAAYDLVIASDGANSRLRTAFADHFEVDIDIRPNKYIWLGADKAFEAFTFAFEQTPHGWIWAHAYKFDD